MRPGTHGEGDWLAAVRAARQRAAEHLLGLQRDEGYWWGELTADTTLESDYILLQLWLHPPQDGVWCPPTRPLVDNAVHSILARQLPDGGFSIYPHGPAEVSATVKAYFALKLAGLSGADPRLAQARERVLELGGIQAANSYVKINLSLFDLYPWEHCPAVPPELALLPGKFLYRMSSWTRAILAPLSVVHAANPRRPLPAGFTLGELFRPDRPLAYRWDARRLGWRNAFLRADRWLKWWERRGWRRLRARAVRAAERWMLERTRHSDGLGAIYPPMMYLIMALDVLGYPPEHPERVEAQRQFARLMVDDGERFFFQPCFSPVWDTAIAAFALAESGAADARALERAADWLVSKEVRRRGDWSVKRPRTEPSGWYFEFANEFYPDIDDTAQVLLALGGARGADLAAQQAAQRRAVRRLVDMQSRDGGWAAFDVDNDWTPLSYMPFADHNAMLDPTCPDITGRVLEALCAAGVERRAAVVRRAVAYLQRTQEAEGGWYGRLGVNYIYGTFLALRRLRTAGEPPGEPRIARAGQWLRSIQNADGGWGESCASYDAGRFVPAPSTASQTGWALLGLVASGDSESSSVRRGIEHLLARQSPDGAWDEDLATGTGFPGVFYLTYRLYRQSFPLLALSTYLNAREHPA